MGKTCWATPEAYIRKQMLEAVLETIGHAAPDCPAVEEPQQHTICDERVLVLDDKWAASLLSADAADELEVMGEEEAMRENKILEDEDE